MGRSTLPESRRFSHSRRSKKISKKHKKAVDRTNKSYKNKYSSMYVRAYNKTADRMNGGEIDKFNARQEKKYGKNFAMREGYMKDYQKTFDKIFTENWARELNSFYNIDKYARETQKLVDKYGMLSWNDLAIANEAKLDEIRRAVPKY